MASKLLLQRRLFRFLQLSPPFFSSILAAPTILSVKASEFMFLFKDNALLPPLSSSRNFCSRSFNLDESQGPLTIDYMYDVHFLVFHPLYSYLILRNHKKLNLMVLAFKFQLFSFKFLILKFKAFLVLGRRLTVGFVVFEKYFEEFKCLSHAQVPQSSLLQEGEFHRLADSTIHSLQEKLEDYGDSVEVDGFDIDYGNDVLTIKLGDLGTYVLNKQTPNRQLWLSSPMSGPSRFDWDRDTKTWIYRRNKANLYKILEGELEQLCGKPVVLS